MCGCVKYMETGNLTSTEFEQMLSANLPDGALHVDDSTSGHREDERLQAAATAAAQRGTSAPLLKEELRLRILQRRMKDGKPEIKPEVSVPKDYELTPAEKEKRERRKEQNRRAARTCRMKKKNKDHGIQMAHARAQEENKQLHTDIDKLRKFQSKMKAWLLTHLSICNVRMSNSGQREQHAEQQEELPYHHQQHQYHQQQFQQQQYQQQQYQQQQFQQQQYQHQQPMNAQRSDTEYEDDGYPDPVFASSVPGPGSAACGSDQEHSVPEPQGPGPVFSDLASQSMNLDSVDMEAALRDIAEFVADASNPQDRGPTVSDPSTAPSIPQSAADPPNFLSTPLAPLQKSEASATSTAAISTRPIPRQTSLSLPPSSSQRQTSLSLPPSSSQRQTSLSLPPSSSQRQTSLSLPPSSSQPVPQPLTAPPCYSFSCPPQFTASASVTTSSSNPGSNSAHSDLPGYPFSTRKRSVDGEEHAGEGGGSPRKRFKSATQPPRTASTLSATGGVTSSVAPSASALNLPRMNRSLACLETGCGPAPLAPFTPSSASCSSSSCLRIPSVSVTRPPPRLSLTSPPYSSSSFSSSSAVTPPPTSASSASFNLCSVTPPPPSPGGQRVVPGSELPTPAPSPALSIPDERARDDEGLFDGLGNYFTASRECEDECLSSRSLLDLLQNGFLSSSQED